MVARLDEIKDQETLLKAYSKINQNCKLILVGDGNKRAYLEGIASELGLNIKKIFPYFVVGLFLWYFTHESGIHST